MLVVDQLLVQRPADALHRSTKHLAFDQRGVQRSSYVLCNDIAQDLDSPGIVIEASVNEVRRGRGSEALRDRATVALDRWMVATEVVQLLSQGGQRHASVGGATRSDNAVNDLQVGRRDLEFQGCEVEELLSCVGGRSLELVVEWVRSRSNVLGRALGLSKKALAQLLDTLGVARSPAGTAEFDLAQVNLGMSALGRVLLKRFDYEPIRQRRRNNFLRMQNRLAGRLTPLREDLPEGTCPLFFPILVPDKRSTVRVLRQRGIGALDWWSHPASATRTEASSDSQFLRDHLLGLPIHQDVTPAQSEYIADEVLRLELRVRPAHALR